MTEYQCSTVWVALTTTIDELEAADIMSVFSGAIQQHRRVSNYMSGGDGGLYLSSEMTSKSEVGWGFAEVPDH